VNDASPTTTDQSALQARWHTDHVHVWPRRPRASRYDAELWMVVLQFEVRRVADLPPFEEYDEARMSNATFNRMGRTEWKWKRDPDWLLVAQVSVRAVHERPAWSHGDWARLGDRTFPELPDRYAFGSLFGGLDVSEVTWYDGRHRALAQIDAGADEIVVCA
jgi:hypothetical protein